jgi:hypothetical protein
MALTKLVNGERVPLTPEEEAEFLANEQAYNDGALDRAKAQAKQDIYKAIQDATVTTDVGNVFKCDDKSKGDLLGVVYLAQINSLDTAEFKPKNHTSLVSLPVAELIEAGNKIEAKIKEIMRG